MFVFATGCLVGRPLSYGSLVGSSAATAARVGAGHVLPAAGRRLPQPNCCQSLVTDASQWGQESPRRDGSGSWSHNSATRPGDASPPTPRIDSGVGARPVRAVRPNTARPFRARQEGRECTLLQRVVAQLASPVSLALTKTE